MPFRNPPQDFLAGSKQDVKAMESSDSVCDGEGPFLWTTNRERPGTCPQKVSPLGVTGSGPSWETWAGPAQRPMAAPPFWPGGG